MAHLPFSVFKRKGRVFYYVQFKNAKGGYLPAVSTKQTTEAEAMETAFKWLREGVPVKSANKDNNPQTNISLSLRESVRDVKTAAEAGFICGELKRQGLLKTYVITESRQAVDFGGFIQNFWDYDSSPYIKEKLRKNHGIHRNYTIGQKLSAEKYWSPFFKGRFLGDITRQDIENFINSLADRKLSAGRRNIILKAGTIPLRWAFAKEIIEKDVTVGITWFSGKTAERQILSPEIVRAIFRVEWKDTRSRAANMLAAVTGLRAGEIQGLRIQDLGNDCIYIRHSWNFRDKLKTTKNNDAREVMVPFPFIISDLLNLARQNPHGADMDSYVFWAEKSSSKPMEARLFLEGLRDALIKIGMSEKSASVYVFHGWRHFFASYMRGKLADKLLQSETGHKSISQLVRYSKHELAGDREKIQKVKKDVFGELMISQQPLLPFAGTASQ